MAKTETLEDFYKNKTNWMPDNLKKEIGHFNVFRTEEFLACKTKPAPSYSRKDFYKISLVTGGSRIQYADKTIETDGNILLFANPLVPYNWVSMKEQFSGFFCIFTEAFFNQFGNIKEYPVFQPAGNPVYVLTDTQLADMSAVFTSMLEEIESGYLYKYDVLRNHVFTLVHSAMKMQPASTTLYTGSNACTRVSSLFMELLERQFPIESPLQQVKLRAPAEFAQQLSVHVNHLNRSLKETTGKTTSQLIADRVAQEARALLKHTHWNISEIGWCLGFEEPPHFINFFRKHAQQSPRAFRSEG